MRASSYSFPLSDVTELLDDIILQWMEKKQTAYCRLPAIRIRMVVFIQKAKNPCRNGREQLITHQACFNIAAYSVYVEKDAWIMLYDFSQTMQAEALMSCLRR